MYTPLLLFRFWRCIHWHILMLPLAIHYPIKSSTICFTKPHVYNVTHQINSCPQFYSCTALQKVVPTTITHFWYSPSSTHTHHQALTPTIKHSHPPSSTHTHHQALTPTIKHSHPPSSTHTHHQALTPTNPVVNYEAFFQCMPQAGPHS